MDLSLLRKLLTGLTIPQEYVCVPLENFQQPLSVVLTVPGRDFFMDVTEKHLFLGYKPLIIAIVLPLDEYANAIVSEEQMICLNFVANHFNPDCQWNKFPSNRNCVSRLVLKKIGEKVMECQRVIFYEGQYGEHSFLNSLHQFVNRQRERFKKAIPGNVTLAGNLYDQVRIAYATPRTISLMTITDGRGMNMFPTDLHGPVGKKFYISSLRKGGKANAQVEKNKKLALSKIDIADFISVYALGKNHMMEMRDVKSFESAKQCSKIYKIPLPAATLSYRELTQFDSFDAGIHRIHFYEQVYEENLRDGMTLAHIHQFYAQWRLDRAIPTNLWMR
jgi:hypothetical protein